MKRAGDRPVRARKSWLKWLRLIDALGGERVDGDRLARIGQHAAAQLVEHLGPARPSRLSLALVIIIALALSARRRRTPARARR